MKIQHIDNKRICFWDHLTGKDYELQYYHEADCCEHVYADFESIPREFVGKDGRERNIFYVDFEEDLDKLIEEVEGQGFMLCAKDGSKVLVNCYDIQNGYYSSNLEVILYELNTVKEKEITEMIHEYE